MKNKKSLDADVIFYILPKEVNSATSFYIKMLKEAFLFSGLKCVDISSLSDIYFLQKQLVVTINVKEFVFVFFRKRHRNVVNWFQGVLPEELGMNPPSIYVSFKKLFYTFAEWFTLRSAFLNIFVSDSMHTHYQKKYKYNKTNYIIIPCFNQEMKDWRIWDKERYNKPSFVYAGNLAPWQCLKETLLVYKNVEDIHPDSLLIILTAEQDHNKAVCLIKENGIRNYQVKHIPLVLLDVELQKYKYGFILRDKSVVNHVATPTKMNSYVANGLIPIYSNVIGDFKKIFKGKYIIEVPEASKVKEITKEILRAEEKKYVIEDVFNEFSLYMNVYYNKSTYIRNFKVKLENILRK